MHTWAVVTGALLAGLFLWDSFQTMVLSRRIAPRLRPTRALYRLLFNPLRVATRAFPPGTWKENILTVFGPMVLLLLIAFWAFGLIFAFGLLQWGIGPHVEDAYGASGFDVDLYASGTTFFTLGLGDVTPRMPLARVLTVVECGLGFALLALVIGYVPLISQAYSRREVSISMLDARAGSPPTAGRLLGRHFHDGGEDLRELLRDWERWSAELLESHVSFPALSFFRSQHFDQSWVSALTTVLDVCALVIACIEHEAATTARLTFTMARHAVVDLCSVLLLEPRPDAVDRLDTEDELRLQKFLATQGVELHLDEPCIAVLRALRAQYEPHVHALSSFLLMPLPQWLPPAHESDAWHRVA